MIAIQKTTECNDLQYPEINVLGMNPLQDFILVQWDFAQPKLKAGKYTLIRPDTFRKMHYTGIVLACGPEVDEDIKVGDRLIFDQFSRFEKYWDETYGRVALLQESKQGSLFAIIPQRIEIGEGETDFNYDV